MANAANIDKLIDQLRSIPDDQFDMEYWRNQPSGSCETVGCIGGWCAALVFKETGQNPSSFTTDEEEEIAAEFLGLSSERGIFGDLKGEAGELFFPSTISHWYWDRITKAEAIEVLEELKVTGKVNWSKAARRISDIFAMD